MSVQEITSLKQFQEVINSGRPVVIDFWATWCGPCRMISPAFEKMASSGEHGNVGFYKVDVDAVSDVSQEVGIRAMPTFIFFQNGTKVDELVGANPGALQSLVSRANLA